MPALVPAYLQDKNLGTASPGLRFGLFFSAWQADFSIGKENKAPALKDVGKLNASDQQAMKAITERQARLAKITANTLTLDVVATAPFTTGLGNEHPLENGFAFLNPYGLPYLPGSSIKGVLRQAARELASGEWGDTHGWIEKKIHELTAGRDTIDLSMLDVLFGKETQDGDKEHVRGVLSFWDSLPQVPENSLAVDIMTPHQSHYYQNGQTPHDSDQPNPISFLTLPPGTKFAFHVCCDLPRLQEIAPDLAENSRWKLLLESAFEHAFAWLGFGAKKSIGYGAMQIDPAIRARQEKEAAERREKTVREERERQREAELGALSPVDRAIRECLDARKDPNLGEIPALKNAIKAGQWQGDLKRDIALCLREMMQSAKKWKETTQAKKPEKDGDHQDTLLVKSWIDGK
ncbi:MAG: type III-B CRISPR module RAMP protein Cmr6 [Pseudoxanthomonas sp.]